MTHSVLVISNANLAHKCLMKISVLFINDESMIYRIHKLFNFRDIKIVLYTCALTIPTFYLKFVYLKTSIMNHQ